MIVSTSLTISFVLKLLSLSFGLRLKLLDQPAVSRGQFLSQSTLCPIRSQKRNQNRAGKRE